MARRVFYEKHQARTGPFHDGRPGQHFRRGVRRHLDHLFAVLQAVYQFKNATGENRYSEFDITENGEEPDPLEKRMAPPSSPAEENKEPGGGFCPYCGAPAEKDYDFCRRCGKKLP